ncbi:STAS domain-containing protein [Nocardioides dongkuii]|uniref:STAS domain-containing protein n=1 Tax=Nocardioides dongkuii TaxID=2760089 RepID=UPI0015FB9A0B|nr:STAS domain-containing protein [Nocardioides dongkuii]
MITIHQQPEASTAHFTVSGDLDVFGALTLRRGLNSASETCADLRVDLADVEFVDVSALGVMARTWGDLTARPGTSVRLVGTSRQVRALRKAAGLVRLLPDAVDDALPRGA